MGGGQGRTPAVGGTQHKGRRGRRDASPRHTTAPLPCPSLDSREGATKRNPNTTRAPCLPLPSSHKGPCPSRSAPTRQRRWPAAGRTGSRVGRRSGRRWVETAGVAAAAGRKGHAGGSSGVGSSPADAKHHGSATAAPSTTADSSSVLEQYHSSLQHRRCRWRRRCSPCRPRPGSGWAGPS